MSALERALDFLFGYDWFISYRRKPSEGLEYADALERELRARNYRCFLDRRSFAGGQLTRGLQRAIRRSSRIVFVCTPAALESPHCRAEITYALEANKAVAPISFEPDPPVSTPEARDVIEALRPVCSYHEDPSRLPTGPSAELLIELTSHFVNMRKESVQRRTFLAVGALLSVLLVAAVGLAWVVGRQGRALEHRRAVAESRRLAAESLAAAVTDAPLALALAVEALSETERDASLARDPRAEQALRLALARNQGVWVPIGSMGNAVSADGRWLATVSFGQSSLSLIDLAADTPGRSRRELPVDDQWVESDLCFTPNCAFLVGRTRDSRALRWELAAPATKPESLTPAPSRAILVSRDGRWMLRERTDSRIEIVDLDDCDAASRGTVVTGAGPRSVFAFDDATSLLVVRDATGPLRVWAVPDDGVWGEPLQVAIDPSIPSSAALTLSPHARWALLGDELGRWRLQSIDDPGTTAPSLDLGELGKSIGDSTASRTLFFRDGDRTLVVRGSGRDEDVIDLDDVRESGAPMRAPARESTANGAARPAHSEDLPRAPAPSSPIECEWSSATALAPGDLRPGVLYEVTDAARPRIGPSWHGGYRRETWIHRRTTWKTMIRSTSLPAALKGVRMLSVSPCGRFAVSLDDHATAKVWELATTWDTSTCAVLADDLAASFDAVWLDPRHVLVTDGRDPWSDEARGRLFDVEPGLPRICPGVRVLSRGEDVWNARFDESGRWLIARNDVGPSTTESLRAGGGGSLWSVADGELRLEAPLPRPWVRPVVEAGDDAYFVGGRLRLFVLEPIELERSDLSVQVVADGASGRWLLCDDGERRWTLLRGHGSRAEPYAFPDVGEPWDHEGSAEPLLSPRASWLIAATRSGCWWLIDLREGHDPTRLGRRHRRVRPRFAPDDSRLVWPDAEGIVSSLDVRSSSRAGAPCVRTELVRLAEDDQSALFEFDASSRWLGLDVVHADGRVPDATGKHETLITRSAILVWQADRPDAPPFRMDTSELEESLVRFSPAGRWLVTATSTEPGLLEPWSSTSWSGGRLHPLPLTAAPDVARPLFLASHAKPDYTACQFDFSDDDRWLLTNTQDAPNVLWRLDSGDRTARGLPLQVDASLPEHLNLDSLGRHVLASDPSRKRWLLWNLERGDETDVPVELPGYDEPVVRSEFSPDGRLLITTHRSSVRAWTLDLGELRRAADRHAPRNLTLHEWSRYFPGRPYAKTFAHLAGADERTEPTPVVRIRGREIGAPELWR